MLKNEPITTRLREIRHNRGYSLAELARESGIAAPTIQKIEKGVTKNISPAQAPRLAKALEVSIAELYAEIGSTIRLKPIRPIVPVQSKRSGHLIHEPDQIRLIGIWERLPRNAQMAIMTLAQVIADASPKDGPSKVA
jgi:transcriptional regulator with XRE-family HTH domain